MPPHPDGFEEVRGPGGWGFACAEAHAWTAAVLASGRRLRESAAEDPAVLVLHGRGHVWAMRESDAGGSGVRGVVADAGHHGESPSQRGRWVVRPYRRGGSIAGPLLGDRHLRGSKPRPVAEAIASTEALRRGVPTPRVLAGAVYPAGIFYRADLVTEYVAGSQDLATALFLDPTADPAPRSTPLARAGALLAEMARAGVDHPDMNARNVLLVAGSDVVQPIAMVLDLDRCRVRPIGAISVRPMLARLERSLAKIGTRTGKALTQGETRALRAAALGVQTT